MNGWEPIEGWGEAVRKNAGGLIALGAARPASKQVEAGTGAG